MLAVVAELLAEPIIVHKTETRCNDGTPFAYYLRRIPGSTRWFIYLEGGGYCDDAYQLCSDRAAGSTIRRAAGSSVADFPVTTGIFTLLDGYNVAYAPYCSSDLWSGFNLDPVMTSAGSWFFQGYRNVEAMILDLAIPTDDRVILAGSSAGGFGVYAAAGLLPGATLVADGAVIPVGWVDGERVAAALDLWGSVLTSLYAPAGVELVTSDHDPVILAGLGLLDSPEWRSAVLSVAPDARDDSIHSYLLSDACVTTGRCSAILEGR